MTIIDYMELSFIKGVSNRIIKNLYDSFGNVSDVLENPEIIIQGYGYDLFKKIKNRPSDLRKKAEEEIKRANKIGAKLLCLADEDYPEYLKKIPDPPPYIYVMGEIPKNTGFVSVVGSRKMTTYGKVITEKISGFLAENDLVVVSGLASGVDSVAHKTAIGKNGYTIAVLGSGIDQVFPRENAALYRKICKNGCVISEFLIGTKPTKYTFPIRNRIIAGLSLATIVTEAGESSGALITARIANEYGRIVFSVPSNITNPRGKGSNLLIKEGALPLLEPEDILEHLPYLRKRKSNTQSIQLSSIEKQILDLIEEPVHTDTICEKMNIQIDSLMVLLFELEMKGLIHMEEGFVMKRG